MHQTHPSVGANKCISLRASFPRKTLTTHMNHRLSDYGLSSQDPKIPTFMVKYLREDPLVREVIYMVCDAMCVVHTVLRLRFKFHAFYFITASKKHMCRAPFTAETNQKLQPSSNEANDKKTLRLPDDQAMEEDRHSDWSFMLPGKRVFALPCYKASQRNNKNLGKIRR